MSRVRLWTAIHSDGELRSRYEFMKNKEHPLDEQGQQWSWKISLTILCAVIGAIVVLYLFRVL